MNESQANETYRATVQAMLGDGEAVSTNLPEYRDGCLLSVKITGDDNNQLPAGKWEVVYFLSNNDSDFSVIGARKI